MRAIYKEMPSSEAYTLQNAGGVLLLCTHGVPGQTPFYDLAPIAWSCPFDYEPVSRMLAVCDTSHQTYRDVLATGEAVLALASADMQTLCEATGSVSGALVDKYAKFNIPAFRADSMDILIPEGVPGWMECRLVQTLVRGISGILFLDVIKAFAIEEFWKHRLHFVRQGVWYHSAC
ncbi:MAG: flavin reductase [Spirochaetaceae bacterium]|nr:flavin reductase [Spirochaetaceae bacterium]